MCTVCRQSERLHRPGRQRQCDVPNNGQSSAMLLLVVVVVVVVLLLFLLLLLLLLFLFLLSLLFLFFLFLWLFLWFVVCGCCGVVRVTVVLVLLVLVLVLVHIRAAVPSSTDVPWLQGRDFAECHKRKSGERLAIDETVILLHPPRPLVGVSIVMEREYVNVT